MANKVCYFWYLSNVQKRYWDKKNRIPASATPTQIDGGTEQKRDWVPEQVVTSSQEAPNPESC